MVDQLKNVFAMISLTRFNILLLLGLALFGGSIGGRVFQKLKIPQVVGYIIIGILVGQAGFKIIDKNVIEALQPFNYFALGLIGFMIGGELKKDVFLKYGRQFSVILLFEGLSAFFAVFLLVGFIGSLFLGPEMHPWILGLLLGAIAAATAPAGTTDVLWEYKTKGPLTTTLLGIIATDDALSLLLFAVVSSIAGRFLGQASKDISQVILHPIYEIGGAIFIGGFSGLVLAKVLRQYTEPEKILSFSLGAMLFVLGISLTINVSMLLAAMTLGMVVVNQLPRISKELFKLVGGFATPIYVLFFVMVGANLDLSYVTLPVIILVSLYLIGRTAGKIGGAAFGSITAGAPSAVSKYLSLCLFSQSGVAIGLSIVAYHLFPGQTGNIIVVIITLSTFVVQLIGPVFIKYAVTKAGEVGLNITVEDIIRKTKVGEVIDKNIPVINENMTLEHILEVFSNSFHLYYPVVNKSNELMGIITVDSIRQTFMEPTLGNVLIAHDIVEPVFKKISPDVTMIEAKELFDRYNLDYLPVVEESGKVLGLLERHMFDKFISTRMMELEKQAIALG